MKIKLILITSILCSLYVVGCARNNANNDDVAYRNRNGMEPTRVNYNTRNGGPNVTNFDRNNGNINDYDRNDRNIIDVRNNNRNNNVIGENRMRVADKAANRVTDLREVDSANIIVTDNNAYVAAKLENHVGNRLTNKIEKKISDRVKSVDHDIDNVYVSVNPDFYDRMNNYVSDIRTGRPVSGFFDEFSTTIRRIFPDVK